MILLVLDYQPCELVLSSKLQSSQQKKKKRFTIQKSHVSSCFNMRPDANWEKYAQGQKERRLKNIKNKTCFSAFQR